MQRAAVLDVDRDVLPESVGGAEEPHVRRHALELVVAWLLACPEKGDFVPIESESTASL